MATVLITGASSGLGMAAALAFARRNDTVYATVRSQAKPAGLRERAARENLELHTRILDVTRTETFPGLVEVFAQAVSKMMKTLQEAETDNPYRHVLAAAAEAAERLEAPVGGAG